MVKFSEMSRGQFFGVIAAAVVFVIGAVTVVRAVGGVAHWISHAGGHSAASGKLTAAANANFDYLVPGVDSAWNFDANELATDQQRGVVEYGVTIFSGNVHVVVSQQAMPAALGKRNSGKFADFVKQQQPVSHQDVGNGTVYYLPALNNGVQVASGSDTIIYATDKVLMFGRGQKILDIATWTKLLGSMHAH